MSADERYGLLMLTVVSVALALVLVVIGRGGARAEAIAGCELPSPTQVTPAWTLNQQSFNDLSKDVIAQAERHVCHEIRSARDTNGWSLNGTDAYVARLPDGTVSWNVQLRYTLGTYATPSACYLTVNIGLRRPTADLWTTASAGAIQRTSLRGRPAETWETDDNGLVVRWIQDGLRFEAVVIPERNNPTQVTLRDLVPLLASVE